MANGKLFADTIEHSTAGSVDTQYVVNGSAKTWLKYDTSTTTVINDSFNVNSLTDLGTGRTQINLSNSMSNTDYCVLALSQYQNNVGQALMEGPSDATTSNYALWSKSNANAAVDADINSSAVHGDVA